MRLAKRSRRYRSGDAERASPLGTCHRKVLVTLATVHQHRERHHLDSDLLPGLEARGAPGLVIQVTRAGRQRHFARAGVVATTMRLVGAGVLRMIACQTASRRAPIRIAERQEEIA